MRIAFNIFILLLIGTFFSECIAQANSEIKSFEVEVVEGTFVKGHWQNGRKGIWEWREKGQPKPYLTISYEDNGKIDYYDKKSFDLIYSCYGHRVDCLKDKNNQFVFTALDIEETIFSTKYYDNGQLKEWLDKKTNIFYKYSLDGNVDYQKNRTTEEEISFYPNGAKRKVIEKHNDSLITIGFYLSGKMASKSTKCLKTNKRCGTDIEYFENGKIENKKNYINGEIDGESLSFLENGKLREKRKYKMGDRDGVQIKLDDNNIAKGDTIYLKSIYVNGSLVGKPTKCNEKGFDLK